jgi:nicotinamide phosphoribosyltransferase
MNPMLLCDAYKLGHMEQYPSGTTMVYSNFTARSFKHMNSVYPVEKMVFFGLAGVLSEMKEIWDTNFFKKPYSEVEKDFRTKIGHFVSPNWPGYENFKQLHALGFLPLEVRAIKEGSRVKPGVPVLTIHNTRPEFFWLTNYVETYLSAELWKMSTSATIAYAYRQILEKYAELTGSPKEVRMPQKAERLI